MARSLGSLTVDLIARISGFTTPMQQASRLSKQTSKSIQNDWQTLGRSIAAMAVRVAGPLAAAFSARAIGNYATAFTELQNRLRLVTTGTTELARATNQVFDIATRTAQAVDGTAQVYQRFAQNADALGISLDDVAELTETVSQAVAISGASAGAAEAALTQFGQALASGTLRGEELNSVMEQTPALAKAIADGLGITVGQLRAVAKEGDITSAKLVEALRKAGDSVAEQFGRRVLTIPQALTNVQTALTRAIGTIDGATGVTSGFAEAIDSVAKAISNADFSGLIRDIQSLQALFDTLADAVDPFLDVLRQISDWADLTGPTSISAFVYSTVKEIDFLVRSFQSFFGGIAGATEALGVNVKAFFANMFDGILILANDWANGMIAAINRVGSAFNLPEIPQMVLGGDLRTDRPGANLADWWQQGARKASSGPGIQQMYEERIGNRVIMQSITAYEGEYSAQVKKTTDAVKGNTDETKKNTKAKKDQLSAGAQLIEQLQDQLVLYGKETELEKLQAQIAAGRIKFDNEQQRQDALGYAQTLDFLKEATKSAEEAQTWMEKFAKVNQDATTTLGEFAKSAAQNIQSYLGDTLYSALTGSFDGIGQAFAQMLARMAADLASSELSRILLGNYDKTGNIGGLFGSLASGIFNYFNPITASSSFVGGGNALGSLGGNLFGFAGGGFTGAIGANRVAGYVHGNEYVFDAQATSRLGVGYLDSLASGKSLTAQPVIVENHGADVSVQRDAQNRMRVIARQSAMDTLLAEGPGLVASEVGTPNRQAWKAVNQNFKVTPRR